MSKKILFVSTVNLTTNPRILKEINLAVSNHYAVTFLGFKLGNWSDGMDEGLQKNMPGVEFIYLDATRRPFIKWAASTATEKAAQALSIFGISSLKQMAFASSKRSVLLYRQLNKMRQSYSFDMVVAHTLGALYPAFCYAKKNKIPFAFDVEDYHPWESIKGNSIAEVKRREAMMEQMLPAASYVSAAAPLIAKQVKALIPVVNPVTVYNSFAKNEFVKPAQQQTEKIKLVWFSQNINAGRGLELILDIWEQLKPDFELTLIGKLDQQFYDAHLKSHPDIILVPPMKQTDLHIFLSQSDIGLAIDVGGEDKNRQLVITNKILAYYQAGLYIVATDTPAQQQFINEHPAHGMVIAQHTGNALKKIAAIASSRAVIRNDAEARFNAAASFNWENQCGVLVKAWNGN